MELRAKKHGCNFTTLVYLEHLHQLMQKICPFCKKKKLVFLFCTPIFTKLPHQFLYYTHLFNKIFIFFSRYHLSHKPNTTYTTTIIQPPNNHHQATQQPSHHPIQPSYHQWNSHTHSTKPPSTSLQKTKSKDPSSTYPITIIKPHNKNPKIQSPSSSHHHQPTQIQRSKNPFIKIPKPTRNKGKPVAVKVREGEERWWPNMQQATAMTQHTD